jgi:AraC family transcriptional regulator
MEYYGTGKDNRIQKLWENFMSRLGEIHHAISRETWGFCEMLYGDPDDGPFSYIAAAPVRVVEHIPRGMLAKEVPASKFAVFTHIGSLEALPKTYAHIYNVWLPKSGFQADNFGMELYDQRFNFTPTSEFDIYVPIQDKV